MTEMIKQTDNNGQFKRNYLIIYSHHIVFKHILFH